MQDKFRYVRDFAVRGHAMETPVLPSKLDELWQTLRFTVTDNWIYTKLQVQLIRRYEDGDIG